MKATKCIWCRKPATTQVTITSNTNGRVVFDGPLCQGHTDRERRTAELNIHTAEFRELESAKQ